MKSKSKVLILAVVAGSILVLFVVTNNAGERIMPAHAVTLAAPVPLLQSKQTFDVQKAMEIAALKTSKERVAAINAQLHNLADEEFSVLLKKAWEIYGNDLRFFREVLLFWSGKRPKAAALWAYSQELFAGKNARLLSETTAFAWLETDFEGAYKWAASLDANPKKGKWSLVAAILQYVAKTDPEGALKLLNNSNLSARSHDSALSMIFEAWMQENPRRAIERLGQNTRAVNSRAYERAMGEWGRRDPDAATEWLLDQLHTNNAYFPSDAESLGQSNMSIMAKKLWDEMQQRKKISYENSTENDYNEQALLSSTVQGMVSKMANENPSEFAAWIQALPNDDDRTNLLNQLLNNREVYEGAALTPTVSWKIPIANLIADKTQRSQVLAGIVRQWAETDSAAALNWAATQSDPIVQQAGYIASLGVVARAQGGEKALSMLNPNLTSSVKQEATAEIIIGWSDNNPQAALQWAKNNLDMNEPATQKLTIYTAQSWLKQSPDEAAKWIADSSLPQSVKNILQPK